MAETPLFFDASGARCFGVHHEPTGPNQHATGVVLCHPFAEEKLWAHRVFVSVARALAQRGYHVLRFDYRGNGDSDGAFCDSSVETTLADINAAIDLLRERAGVPTVTLLGLRLGATFAAHIAESRSDVDALVLWMPIVDGGRYMQELLRVNLTTQMTVYKEIRADREQLVAQLRAGQVVNVDGYEIALPLFEQTSALHLNGQKTFAGRTLVVHIDRAARQSPELEKLRASYPSAEMRTVQEEPFWKEIERFYDRAPNLFATTIEWLDTPASALNA
jgi:exosortase A-associated hydrolase 2